MRKPAKFTLPFVLRMINFIVVAPCGRLHYRALTTDSLDVRQITGCFLCDIARSFNRTSVGLKLFDINDRRLFRASFNRTSVGLKHKLSNPFLSDDQPFNRTSVGLKQNCAEVDKR